MALLFAASHPGRTSALVLADNYARRRRAADYPCGIPDSAAAKTIEGILRTYGTGESMRFGGEEFALVLYCPANDFGRDLPEHIRRKVEELAITHAGSSASKCLTVSVGVSIVASGAERSLAGAIQMADEALYQAKEEGRNRVVVKESRLTYIETGRFRASKRAVS